VAWGWDWPSKWFEAIIVNDVMNWLVLTARNAPLSAISQPQPKITQKAFVSASKIQYLMR
jgi:hypothetical protein